jgi:PKD repeat protein
MRLPWFFNPHKRSVRAGKSRRPKRSSLRVRSLERRRVLNASIQSIAVPAAALEGSPVTAAVNATGQGQLSYSWSLGQGNTTLATGANPSFNFTPPDDGNYSVNLTVADNSPNSDSKSIGLLVNNQPPVLVVAADQSVDEGQLLDLTGNVNPLLGLFVDDGKLDTHTATVNWGDGSPTESATVLETPGTGSGVLTGSHTYADDGTYTVTVLVTDNNNGVSQPGTFDVTVNDVAPQLINVVGSTINENGFATITAKVDDPGVADTFSIDADWQDNTGTAHITGLGASDNTGTVNNTSYQWTAATRQIQLSHQYVDDGPSPGNNTASDTYHVALTVTDNFLKSTSTTADVVVNNLPPVLTVTSDKMVNEGQLLDLSGQAAPVLGVFIDTGTHDKHTATVDWGDGSGVQPPTLSEAAGSGVLTGTHIYADDGTYIVKVTVSDDDKGTSDVEIFTVAVNDVAPTALLANNGPINEGSSGLVTFSNQFDPSPVDTAAGFHYAYDLNNNGTFDVGDGTYAGSGINASQSVPGTVLVDGPGDYTVKARILDKDGKFTDYTTVIHVNNASPVLTVTSDKTVDEGQLLNLTGNVNPLLGLFVDDGKLDTHTATVDWGDGSPTETATVLETPRTGSGVLTGSHTYADDGTYTVTVLVTDNNNGVSQPGIFHVTVNDVAPQLINVVGSTINESSFAKVTANVQDPGVADTFEVDVNWQDGSATDKITSLGATDTSGTVAGTNYQWTAATRQIQLSHQYVDDGPSPGNDTASDTYHVALTVTDNFLKSTSTTADVIVNNLKPVLVVTGDKTVDEGQLLDLSGQAAPILGLFIDTGTHDKHTATVDWGDGSGVQSPTLSEAAGSGALTGTHIYADDGTYIVKVTVSDDDLGTSDVETFTVTVNDVAPQLINVVGSTINENGVATVTANVQDPGVLDTFSIDVNWQDGNASDQITGLGATDTSGTVGKTSYQWTAATRQIQLSHQYLDDGPSPGNNTASDTYHVALTVTDNFPISTSTTADVIVNNLKPVLVVTGDKTVDEGQLLDLTGNANPLLGLFIDAGTLDKHTATVDWGDGSAPYTPVINEANGSGSLSGSHTYADDGTYIVKVTVSDDDKGTSDVETFTVTVNDVAPQLDNVVGSTINENGVATVSANVQDPGVLDTFSIDVDWQDGNSPDQITGLGASDSSGTVGKTSYQWTAATRQIQLSHQYLDDGPSPGNNTANDTYTVALTVTDNFPKSTSTTAAVIVNNLPPVLTVTGDKTVNEGQLLDLTGNANPLLGLFIDTGTLDKHTATVDWGDCSGLYTPVINEVNGSGSLSGSHTYADDGTYIVKVTVSDDDVGTSDVETFTVTVHNVNPSLTVTPTPPTTIGEGSSVGFGATFIDPGFDNLNNPNPADPANNIADPTHESFTYDVDWGDGRNAITGMTASYTAGSAGTPSSGSFNGSHTYADDGTYTVTVTIHDDNGGTDFKTFTVTVNNVNPTLTLTPTPPTTINEGDSVGFTATFKDPGFDNPANPTTPATGDRFNESFTYDVNWGDGREPITGMTLVDSDGGSGVDSTGAFSGSHIYADDGTYMVTVTIHDDNGGSDTKTFSVTVNNVNPTLTLTTTPPTTINEGGAVGFTATFKDPGFDNPANPTTPPTGDRFNESFMYDVNWGDGRDPITEMTVADSGGGEGSDSTGNFGGSHTYADDGTYLVTVTIHDDNGGSDVKTFTVIVNNVNPLLTVTPTTPTTIDEGSTVAFGAMFTDPGSDNPANPNAAVPPSITDPTHETFRYFVDWGDGRDQVPSTPVADTDSGPGTSSSGLFDGSHTYADDGTYTVTVRIADDNMTGNFTGGVNGVDYVEKTFTVIVHNVDPTLTGTSNLTVDEGQAFTLAGLGVGFKDPGFDNLSNPNPAVPPSITDPTHEAFTIQSINWGDGSIDSSTVAIANVVSGSPGVPTTGQFSHAPHTYADDGTYTVHVTYKDDNGSFVSEALQITVKNVAPTLQLSVGDQTIFESGDVVLPVMATFKDPGFDNPNNPNPADPANNITDPQHESFAYDINWGDGRDTVTAMSVADLNGSPGTPSTGMFGGSHNYADNGTYTVQLAVHDDNGGVSQVLTFHVIVNNVAPSFVPTQAGANFAGDNVSIQGITAVRVGYTDPGYDNPLNTQNAANGGQVAETPVYVVDWGDGTIDATHKYAVDGTYTVTVTITPTGGSSQTFTFNGFTSSANPVLTLVNGQTLNGAETMYTYVVNWGDKATTTLQLSLASPGNPIVNTGDPLVNKGITKVLSTNRASGSASVLTTGSSEIQHQYLGPPDPMHPTQDIKITMIVADDDNAQITDSIFVKNPGIQTQMVAIDTTPDVARLEFPVPALAAVFAEQQATSTDSLQNIDSRAAAGEMAAASDRYLELRVVYPDDTEGQGYRIKDEALNDLRGFFKTLPDGKYRVYLVRTENNSHRLVIEVNVRRGHVIDMSDESEGTRDRPPTSEDKGPPAKPLNENPQLQPVPGGVGSNVPNVPAAAVTTATPPTEMQSAEDAPAASRESNPESAEPVKRAAAFTGLGLVAAARPWSEEVDEALAEADERAWQRLRRAGRRGRFQHHPAPSGVLKG